MPVAPEYVTIVKSSIYLGGQMRGTKQKYAGLAA
jgi:hypothetical protein